LKENPNFDPATDEGVVKLILTTPQSLREHAASAELFGFNEEQVKRLMDRVRECDGDDQVLRLIPSPTEGYHQISGTGPGIGLPALRAVASAKGVSVLTTGEQYTRIIERETKAINGPMQIATQAFSRLKLQFLNNVPVDYAVGLRRDGAMCGFRNFLRELSTATSEEAGIKTALSLSDRLNAEYQEYQDELRKVQTKLAATFGTSVVATGASLASPWLAGTLGIGGTIGLLGTAMVTQMAALGIAFDRRRTLERKPISLLLRLDKLQSN
jgi:hypothetical protein